MSNTKTTMDETFVPDCLAPYAPGSICYCIDEFRPVIHKATVYELTLSQSGRWICRLDLVDLPCTRMSFSLSVVFTSFAQARQELLSWHASKLKQIMALAEPAPAQEDGATEE